MNAMQEKILNQERTIKQLERALGIIAESAGDFTQALVSDALYEVEYYTPEEDIGEE